MSASQPATSASTSAVEVTGHEPRKHTQRFRRATNAVKLDPEQRRRQAEAMALGWKALGSRDAVMAFFNAHSDALGGRPLDLAVDSDEGLTRVTSVLREAAFVPVNTSAVHPIGPAE